MPWAAEPLLEAVTGLWRPLRVPRPGEPPGSWCGVTSAPARAVGDVPVPRAGCGSVTNATRTSLPWEWPRCPAVALGSGVLRLRQREAGATCPGRGSCGPGHSPIPEFSSNSCQNRNRELLPLLEQVCQWPNLFLKISGLLGF